MVKPVGNNVIVKFDGIVNDSIECPSGMKLYIDPSWEIQDHVVVTAEVEGVGGLVTEDIAPGDIAYISYYAVLMALGKRLNEIIEYPNEKWIEDEEGLHVVIGSGDIYLVEREGKMRNVNNRVLVKPYVEVKSAKAMFNNEWDLVKPSNWRVIELNTDTKNIEVFHTDRSMVLISGDETIRPGDIVIHRALFRERIGFSMHNRIPGIGKQDSEIYTLTIDDIDAIL